MTFMDVLHECISNRDLVSEFDRLTGHHLSRVEKRTALDIAIDQACGRDDAAMADFVAFVRECIWDRFASDEYLNSIREAGL